MWKKLDNPPGSQSDFPSKQNSESSLESLGDALIESLIDTRPEKERRNLEDGPPAFLAEDYDPPSSSTNSSSISSPTMTSYTEAVNEFTRHATAFIEQLPLLAKARVAYEQAMKASAEMRRVLDTGEENLRTLMSQLEQGVNVQASKLGLEKKSAEQAKVETIRANDDSNARVKRFP
ncbi:MAG: hypothetical protein WBV69_22330 [Candidatus Sulfotelmatobacter sp.]